MSDPLVDYLRKCCLKVLGKRSGCGFYIAPQLLVTCAHVIGRDFQIGDQVKLQRWEQKETDNLIGEIVGISPDDDIALLQTNIANLAYVPLSSDVKLNDDLTALGFTKKDDREEFDQLTALYEGETLFLTSSGRRGIESKFKSGQVEPGYSGGPLLNLSTGFVMGVVVATRDRDYDLGGWAIDVSVITSLLKKSGQQMPLIDSNWPELQTSDYNPNPGNRDFKEDISENDSLDMIWIPEGKFLMGSPIQESERFQSEHPQHNVSIQSFYIGKYVITRAQWQIVANWNEVDRNIVARFSDFQNKNQPVQGITWDDAVEFCKRLSHRTRKKYSLPSEAQWEYACRGGTTTPFCFGETITLNDANYNSNYTYGNSPKMDFRGQITDVSNGSFPSNSYGLNDMHGNIWEMCLDTWHQSYDGAPSDGSAWIDNNGITHVVRGGSCRTYPGRCRSAARDQDQYTLPQGFRIVCQNF